MQTVGVRLPDDVIAQVDAEAKALGITRSEAMHQFLRLGIAASKQPLASASAQTDRIDGLEARIEALEARLEGKVARRIESASVRSQDGRTVSAGQREERLMAAIARCQAGENTRVVARELGVSYSTLRRRLGIGT